jgi:hypothetical protein
MQALPTVRRREAGTTSYVADYLTRSVRRASGLVLVGYSYLGIIFGLLVIQAQSQTELVVVDSAVVKFYRSTWRMVR